MLASSNPLCCERHVLPIRDRFPPSLTRLPRAVVVVLLLAAAGPLPAQDDLGRFEVRSAHTKLESGVWYLDARIEYRLSADTREALAAGVPLIIRLDVELSRSRRFWFDSTHALSQRYRVEYHALTERYLVANLNSGEQASFSTLFSALNHLGRIEQLPLIDAALLEPDREYDLRVRAALDVERLSGPLRLLAFWRRDWSLASEWHGWQLQND